MGELLREDPGVLVAREVTVLDPPAGDGVDDAADQLPHRGLALGRSERTAEVLLGHDVRGVLRPKHGELHAALFEGVAALLVVGNDCVADLPLHLVERVSPLLGEMASERELARLEPYVLLLRSHLALLLRDPGEGPWTDGLTSPWGQVVENHTGVIRGILTQAVEAVKCLDRYCPTCCGTRPEAGTQPQYVVVERNRNGNRSEEHTSE